jgi:putative transposase
MAYFHVWFSPKGRRSLLDGDILDAVRRLLPEIAVEKGIALIEYEVMVDHVHMLLNLPERNALPNAMMLLKGVSARRIFERFPELKLDARTDSFWQAGYGSKIVPSGAVPTVRRYIRTQSDRLEKYVR